MFEWPISWASNQASTFTKIAYFSIIQTFFISVISGSLVEEINKMVHTPVSTVDLLANSLPSQSTYFMQIAFVGTVLTIPWENLRALPMAYAFIRRFMGPRLTEKQRQTTFLEFIRPFADPRPFEVAQNMGQVTVLYFMIVLVRESSRSSLCLKSCSNKSHRETVFLLRFIKSSTL